MAVNKCCSLATLEVTCTSVQCNKRSDKSKTSFSVILSTSFILEWRICTDTSATKLRVSLITITYCLLADCMTRVSVTRLGTKHRTHLIQVRIFVTNRHHAPRRQQFSLQVVTRFHRLSVEHPGKCFVQIAHCRKPHRSVVDSTEW
jgi:hypothetical protein